MIRSFFVCSKESKYGAEATQSVTHAVSNKVGTTTLNACAAGRAEPTAPRRDRSTPSAGPIHVWDTKISDTEPGGPFVAWRRDPQHINASWSISVRIQG